MDYKKLIGTIIGVTLFAVLIAGATFAWLTFGTTIVSDNVNVANSMNFLVDYNNGDDNNDGVNENAINNIPMVDTTLVTAEQAAKIAVIMTKHNNSPDGHGYITLTTTSTDELTTDGIVRWAICRDTDIETGGSAAQVDDVCGATQTTAEFEAKALNTGKITTAGTVVLLNDSQLTGTKCSIDIETAKSCSAIQNTLGSSTLQALLPTSGADTTGSVIIPTTGVSYFVYFWLDGETINNTHKLKTYTGYIGAGANQLVQ